MFRRPKQQDGGAKPAAASVFQRMLDLLNAAGPLRASFDDLTGVTLDYPQLFLPLSYEIHDCSACLLAKSTGRGQQDCALNKHAANRLAIRKGLGFSGLCHRGLLDIVEPLVLGQAVLGVFYYGSVVVRERENESRERVVRHCRRRGLDPAASLQAWSQVPRISAREIPGYRERLGALAESCRLWCEALAVPPERYPLLADSVYWVKYRAMPPLIRAALKFVARRFGEACGVADIASHLRCHPNYLSGEFKRHTGENLAVHVQKVRIERAKAMLRAGRLSVGEIAFQCGFADPSHFIRIFRSREKATPRQFQHAKAEMPKT
jgi:AraC-like DNA-binding protein/ligand-binding sensor protein